MTFNVALIGAGRIGKVHAKSIAADAGSRLVAVADIMTEAADELAKAANAEAMSIDQIMADDAVDAILVASSTNTHADLIEQGTAAGKAVLCEKPVDLSLERAITCMKTAANTHQPVMIAFNRRFDPNHAALKAAADAGEIGKIETLAITSFDPAPPPVSYIEVSGGLYRDMMIHDFDMACWLMGGTPETVTATGTCLVDEAIGDAGDVDTAMVMLQWADGRLASIRNTRRAAYGHDQRIELMGSEGLLTSNNMLENTVTRATADGVSGAKPVLFFLERYMRAYEAEWNAFVKAVQEKSVMPVTIQDGVNALALAEAANRSRAEGRTVTVEPSMLGRAA